MFNGQLCYWECLPRILHLFEPSSRPFGSMLARTQCLRKHALDTFCAAPALKLVILLVSSGPFALSTRRLERLVILRIRLSAVGL